MKSFILNYIRKPWVLVILAVLLLTILGTVFLKRSPKATDDFITVKNATVTAGVSVTGKVKSAEAVDLAFEKSGTVSNVTHVVGDRVSPRDILVMLSNADLRAQVAQAEASVTFQQAKLSELKKGTRPEQLKITQTKLDSAGQDLATARANLVINLQTGYSSTEDAIHNKVDEFFTNARTLSPQLANTTFDGSQKVAIESGRVEVETRLSRLSIDARIASSSSDITRVSTEMKQDVAEAKLFLDNLAFAINSNTIPANYKADLSAARTEVTAALSSILAADEKYTSALAARTLAQNQLSLEQAGSVSDEIDAEQAQVSQAEASVASARAALAKTYIRSPIEGVITRQNAKIGEIAPGNTPLISVISDAKFQIEANIAEADIAKVKVGQKASVTLDAYGSDVPFTAVVVTVDPAETIVDAVPTYKTTLQFDEPDERIKSGMTANIDIQGESHPHVLAIPQRAIISHDGGKYVRVKTGTTIQEVKVTTGIHGEDGSIEITNGLNTGDTVAISRVVS